MLFPMKIKEQVGYLNRRGEIVILPRFETGTRFAERRAVVEIDGLLGMIDDDGCIIVEPCFHEFSPPSEGLCLARLSASDRLGWLDREGSWAIEPQYDEASSFHEGVASVKTYGNGYWVDYRGGILYRDHYEKSEPIYRCGRLRVMGKGKYGFVDRRGNVRVPVEYDSAWVSYRCGVVGVLKDSIWKCLDTDGETLLELDSEKWTLVGVSGQRVLVKCNQGGVEILTMQLDAVRAFRQQYIGHSFINDLLWIGDASSGVGCVDVDGNWRVPPIYSMISEFHGSSAVATLEQEPDRYVLIRKEGGVIPTASDCVYVDYLGDELWKLVRSGGPDEVWDSEGVKVWPSS